MKKKLAYLLGSVIVLVALSVVGIYYYNSIGYVGKVAGEKISKAEFNFFLSIVKEEIESAAAQAGKDEQEKKDFWNTDIDGQSAAEAAKKQALEKAKEYKIQVLMAKEGNTTLDENDKKKVSDFIDNQIKEKGGKNQAEEWVKGLYGITLTDYKALCFDSLLIQEKYMSQEQKNINLSDEDIKKYYNENRNDADKVTVRHILYSTVDSERNPLPKEKQDEAKKKADEMLLKVKSGADMKALAKQYSEDPGVKENEGEYSFSNEEGYAQEFKDWSFAAKVGDAEIVQTMFGYHVMKLEKRTEFEDVKETVKNRMAIKKYSDKIEDMKKDSKFNVEINDKVYKAIKII